VRVRFGRRPTSAAARLLRCDCSSGSVVLMCCSFFFFFEENVLQLPSLDSLMLMLSCPLFCSIGLNFPFLKKNCMESIKLDLILLVQSIFWERYMQVAVPLSSTGQLTSVEHPEL
jgi:hypothetical protein